MKAAYIEATGPAEATHQVRRGAEAAPARQVLVAQAGRGRSIRSTPICAMGRTTGNCPSRSSLAAIWPGQWRRSGPRRKRFKVGDRVWGSNQGLMGRQGTFAEYCAVDRALALSHAGNVTATRKPPPRLVGITAHLGLFREAKLKSANRSSSMAAPAAWARWSCKWRKSPARRDRHGRQREKVAALKNSARTWP